MKLIYIYHSCYAVEGDGFTLLFDYFKDQEAEKGRFIVKDYILTRPGSLYVFASHGHADHFNSEVLSWKEEHSNIHYIFSKDIVEAGLADPADAVYLEKGAVYKDDRLSVQAFGSTDLGVSYCVDVEGKHIFHAGDLNNWHWNEEVTPQEAAVYEDFFLTELSVIAKKVSFLDLAMFPVDPRLGKDYMRGAQQFIDYIKVKLFAPMHFGAKYEQANAFAAFARINGVQFASCSRPGDSIEF